jgi:hypothetical protein
MKRLFFCLLVSIFLIGVEANSSQDELKDSIFPPEIQEMPCQFERSLKDTELTFLFSGAGCCSYHGGVAGCRGGRVVCADGTLSPSCRCQADNIVIEQ